MSSTLHLISHHTLGPQLQDVIELCNASDSILLLQDGVLYLISQIDLIKSSNLEFYALSPDCQSRGITSLAPDHPVCHVDYEGFVSLITQHDKSCTW